MKKEHVNIRVSRSTLDFINSIQERYQLSRSEAFDVNTFFSQCSCTEEDMDYMYTKLYKKQDGRRKK